MSRHQSPGTDESSETQPSAFERIAALPEPTVPTAMDEQDGLSASAFVITATPFVWFAGLLLSALPLLVSATRNRLLRRRARFVMDRSQILDVLRRQLDLDRKVDWMESDQPVVPMTWGVLRPIVMFPDSWRGWSAARQRLVLLHELSHVKRFDVAFQLVGRVTCALYWFHPLAWYGIRRLRIERELACDDCVLMAGAKPSEYATELLDIARRFPARGLSTAVAMAQTSNLEQRIRSLLDSARSHLPIGPQAARLLLLLAAIIVTGVAVIKPATVADDTKPDAALRETTESLADDTSRQISLSGRVHDSDGKPIAGAKLWGLSPHY